MTDKRRQILEAASAVFRTMGLPKAGMRDIAAVLGMTAGNLYYYFSSKQEILAYCQKEALRGLLGLSSHIRSRDLRADTRLYLIVLGHVVLLNETIPGSLAHLEVEILEEPWRAEIVRQRDSYEKTLRGLVSEGIEAGIFRSTDPKLAALAILGAVNWTVKWYRPAGRRSATDVGEAFAEQLVRGLLAPGTELEAPGEDDRDGVFEALADLAPTSP